MLFIIENKEDLLKAERLYAKHKHVMLSVANSILKDNTLSEDAVHSSFVRIIDNLHKIDEDNPVRTKNFLYIICRNVSFDIYNARLGITHLSDDMDFEDGNAEPSEIIINEEYLNNVSDAITKLNPIYQDIIYLKYFHNYNNSEISELLHISKDAVKKRIQRGKAYLHTILNKKEINF